MQPDRGKRLDVRLRIDAGLAAVAAILSPHDFAGRQRPHRPERAVLLVADRVDVAADRRVHGQQGDQFEQMVLDDVANGADAVVEAAPALDAERFGHRDLRAAHVLSIPDRLEKGIREAEVQQVLDRFLAEVVVDPEDRRFGEALRERLVERPGGCQVAAERLLDDDARVLVATEGGEAAHHSRERIRRNGEVEERP